MAQPKPRQLSTDLNRVRGCKVSRCISRFSKKLSFLHRNKASTETATTVPPTVNFQTILDSGAGKHFSGMKSDFKELKYWDGLDRPPRVHGAGGMLNEAVGYGDIEISTNHGKTTFRDVWYVPTFGQSRLISVSELNQAGVTVIFKDKKAIAYSQSTGEALFESVGRDGLYHLDEASPNSADTVPAADFLWPGGQFPSHFGKFDVEEIGTLLVKSGDRDNYMKEEESEDWRIETATTSTGISTEITRTETLSTKTTSTETENNITITQKENKTTTATKNLLKNFFTTPTKLHRTKTPQPTRSIALFASHQAQFPVIDTDTTTISQTTKSSTPFDNNPSQLPKLNTTNILGPHKAFTLFPKLPKELRDKIWGHASSIPRAIALNLYDRLRLPQDRAIDMQIKVPAIMHTHLKSRKVVVEHYTPCPKRCPVDQKVGVQGHSLLKPSSLRTPCHERKAYVNFAVDNFSHGLYTQTHDETTKYQFNNRHLGRIRSLDIPHQSERLAVEDYVLGDLFLVTKRLGKKKFGEDLVVSFGVRKK